MRSRIVRLLIPFVWVVSLAADWPPPEMPDAVQFKAIQAQMRASHLAPSAKVPPAVWNTSLPRTVSEAEAKAALERFQRAFFVGGRLFGKQIVEADVFLLPNPEASTVRVTWTGAVDDKGRSLLGAKVEPAELDLRSGQVELPLRDPEDEAPLARATARVAIEAPTGFDELTVPCSEIGKPARSGSLNLAVEKCAGDVFVALVDGLGEADQVVPLDADKRALATSESMRMFLFSGKSLEDLTYEEFKKGPGKASRIEARAKGAVAFVRLLHPRAARKVELDVVATPEVPMEEFGPKSRVRYLAPPEPLPPFVSLEESALALALQSGRSCAMMGYNAPGIELVLPTAANSLMVKVELARPALTGGPKAFEVEENGLDERRLRYRWTLRGGGDKPLSFKTLDATATVKYPLRVVTRTLKDGEAGAHIEGHKVTIPLGEDEELADGSFGRVQGILGYDAAGRALKPFGVRESNGEGVHTSFMGPVARVEVTTVSGWIERKVTARLKPAPLRPADRAGLCD